MGAALAKTHWEGRHEQGGPEPLPPLAMPPVPTPALALPWGGGNGWDRSWSLSPLDTCPCGHEGPFGSETAPFIAPRTSKLFLMLSYRFYLIARSAGSQPSLQLMCPPRDTLGPAHPGQDL